MTIDRDGMLPSCSFDVLKNESHIHHFITTRHGGTSEGTYSSLNLSYAVGDADVNVDQNRKLVEEALGCRKLIFPVQTHSDHIKLVDHLTPLHALNDTDALITASKGLGIGVMSADCVPILFYDPIKQVVGAAHCGWRGTVARLAAKVVLKMVDEFGSLPSNILVGIGPSISSNVYEVGEDVAAIVKNAFTFHTSLLTRNSANPSKFYLDLWKANEMQLVEVGVSPQHIEVSGICTYSSNDDFFSARRLSIQSGRFAAVICLSM